MEPNNFEKNVQQKLDEFKIPPSDAVWTNVEKRIGKKRKDRKVIFILFFLILFLLSGGYWLFNAGNNRQNKDAANVVKTDSKQTNNKDSLLNKPLISSADNSKKHDTASISSIESTIQPTHQPLVFQKESGSFRRSKKQKKLTEAGNKPKERTGIASQNENNDSKQVNNEENEIALNATRNLPEKKSGIPEKENKNQTADSINSTQNNINSGISLSEIKSEKNKNVPVVKKDSSAKKDFEGRKKNKWVFGVTFSGGASLIGNNIFGIYTANPNYPQNINGGGNVSGGGGAYYYPSAINNSFAFIGGAFAEKNISAKSKISFGISYKYFSLINKVGMPVAFASYQFTSVNNVNSYRNNFHYLELPVSVKFQLNNSKTLPVYWQAGISISQLISSNALQFQYSPGWYYNDNSLFNKTQFGLSTGLSATLFAKQKTPVTIGPYFYYSASKLAGKGLYQDKHFCFVGIRAEISFFKK